MFLDITGRPADGLDGQSLTGLLSGQTSRVRDDVIFGEAYGHQIPCWQRMVRTRDAKYIHNPTDHDEYYDLAADPWETTNIIDDAPADELARLRGLLKERIEKTNDPVIGWSRNLL